MINRFLRQMLRSLLSSWMVRWPSHHLYRGLAHVVSTSLGHDSAILVKCLDRLCGIESAAKKPTAKDLLIKEVIQKSSRQVFYIWSPDYTHMHSGVRCLYLLCHHLNRLGYEAYITGRHAPTELLICYADHGLIAQKRQEGIDDIVIYPEIVGGNPLGGRKVVRYLLNKPGFIVKGVTASDYGAQDYIIHFGEECRDKRLISRSLRIPLVDTKVFNRVSEAQQRSGFLLYSVRYTPNANDIPAWVSPQVFISPKTPRDPGTLADLYRQSKALIVWERTAAVGEAIHCGCPVVMIPGGFNFYWWPTMRRYAGAGLVLGWNESQIALAQSNIDTAITLYRRQSLGLDQAIHAFVAEARQHFAGHVGI
jgi:hypothetical protein